MVSPEIRSPTSFSEWLSVIYSYVPGSSSDTCCTTSCRCNGYNPPADGVALFWSGPVIPWADQSNWDKTPIGSGVSVYSLALRRASIQPTNYLESCSFGADSSKTMHLLPMHSTALCGNFVRQQRFNTDRAFSLEGQDSRTFTIAPTAIIVESICTPAACMSASSTSRARYCCTRKSKPSRNPF